MMKVIAILFYLCAYVLMFDLTIEKTELTYFNEKYYNYLSYTLRRASRRSPYVLNVYQDLKYPLGNNFTVKYTLYEVISGREVLTPVQFVLPTCDAINKDPYIGKLFKESLPKNFACPMPAGPNNWTNIILRFTNWPFLPFTYSSLYVRTLTTMDGYINKDIALKAKFYAVIKQYLQDDKSKMKPK